MPRTLFPSIIPPFFPLSPQPPPLTRYYMELMVLGNVYQNSSNLLSLTLAFNLFGSDMGDRLTNWAVLKGLGVLWLVFLVSFARDVTCVL